MKPKNSQKIIVITGPTASGKTKLTIELAKKINAEVICADSRIIYKNLDIVSAKPSVKEQDGIVHHLIDIIEPNIEYSAGDFINDAKKAIDEITKKGKNIIVSGGTWFYIKSLLDDKKLPNSSINKKLREELNKLDNAVLWEKLNNIDPKRAGLIHQNNKDKVIRSLEMIEAIGEPISTFKRQDNTKYDSIWFIPQIDRTTLYDRINKRVDIMLKQGLFEEWQKNKKLYPKSTILMNTIGYKEFFELEKKVYPDFETAIDKIKQHTRNFAKRQLTYFRSNELINPITSIDEILKEVL